MAQNVCACCAFYLAVCVWQTDDSVCVVFPDHPPEICHRAAERSLAHYELLAVVMSLRKHKPHQPTSTRLARVFKGPFNKTNVLCQSSHRDVGGVDVTRGVCIRSCQAHS